MAIGALLRYWSILDHGLPTTEALGIALQEEWNAQDHFDATIWPGDVRYHNRLHKGEPAPNPEIVVADQYDFALAVPMRWNTILDKISSSLLSPYLAPLTTL